MTQSRIVWLTDAAGTDLAAVGGKNASLGVMLRELTAAGIKVPEGFATTSAAYREYLDAAGLGPVIARQIRRYRGRAELASVGTAIRDAFGAAELPAGLVAELTTAYQQLGGDGTEVAVRSSATAEDLPDASFAGQQETFLNVRNLAELLDACRRCYASLFTDRAISYREERGFDHAAVALSIGVQRMVRSDLGSSGVMFTLDSDSGFPGVVQISAAWGLGESVVSGQVDPDEYLVFKPKILWDDLRPILSRRLGSKEIKVVYGSGGGTTTVATSPDERGRPALDDDDVLRLARWGLAVENHYGRPMDIEWAKDGRTGELFLVQARPETVQTRREAAALRSYRLKETGRELVTGLAVGEAIADGRVCLLDSPADIGRFVDGSILVTRITDPDWEPIMRRAAAIVTDHGGRTSHAAIVSRELGVPAIVGTASATTDLRDGQHITVSCAQGERGIVYEGELEYDVTDLDLGSLPQTRTKVMLNLADPAAAFRWWRLPADGVGLVRIEFVVSNHIKVHPMALIHYDTLDADEQREVDAATGGAVDREAYLVDRLTEGIARIAASRWPDPVIVRTSDFKTNEYARLIGGSRFEPAEENPMIGWRGASRYYSPGYREGFALECRALRKVRDELGLTNVVVMIPFCRTLGEAHRVLGVMADEGLRRGDNGLQVYVMAEIPANIILADEFAERFDGFSIGSNDLTQLTLGVDRDSETLAALFNERDPAVARSIEHLIRTAHREGRKVGLCGQRPSDDPGFATFLVHAGIDSVSVTPDSFFAVKTNVAEAERSDGFVHPRDEFPGDPAALSEGRHPARYWG
ncbi:phosphoenolpyruvate synthase [Kribbella sindirgiensis]|uniref:Phosphoenolpyruvate synthase n=1 Tax=Kribbella sindirgiensis TaxID=1124744 RepID=A0A4R0I7L4_9ACTN|nr:phosphoenolpyruvate synthase [Kribbella sindirgiensis]TCC21582.1 phosphoenolpyruvate synthase [Kribbella sindirgiensis]